MPMHFASPEAIRQTGLLGWYAYKRHQFREALEWFKQAIARGGDAMVAHGGSDTMKTVGRGLKDFLAGRLEITMMTPVAAKGIDF